MRGQQNLVRLALQGAVAGAAGKTHDTDARVAGCAARSLRPGRPLRSGRTLLPRALRSGGLLHPEIRNAVFELARAHGAQADDRSLLLVRIPGSPASACAVQGSHSVDHACRGSQENVIPAPPGRNLP